MPTIGRRAACNRACQNLAPCILLDRLGPYPRIYPRALAGH
jgi:hypothetical protein